MTECVSVTVSVGAVPFLISRSLLRSPLPAACCLFLCCHSPTLSPRAFPPTSALLLSPSDFATLCPTPPNQPTNNPPPHTHTTPNHHSDLLGQFAVLHMQPFATKSYFDAYVKHAFAGEGVRKGVMQGRVRGERVWQGLLAGSVTRCAAAADCNLLRCAPLFPKYSHSCPHCCPCTLSPHHTPHAPTPPQTPQQPTMATASAPPRCSTRCATPSFATPRHRPFRGRVCWPCLRRQRRWCQVGSEG